MASAGAPLPVPPLPLNLLQKVEAEECGHQKHPLTAGSDRSCATPHCGPPSATSLGRRQEAPNWDDAALARDELVNDCEGHDHGYRQEFRWQQPQPGSACWGEANNDTAMEDADADAEEEGMATPRAAPAASPQRLHILASAPPASSYRTPVGTPRVSPHSPLSPSMMSPLRLVGTRPPCSVKLTGSARLVGDVVLPLPPLGARSPTAFGATTASPDGAGRPGVQRALPFTRCRSASPPTKVSHASRHHHRSAKARIGYCIGYCCLAAAQPCASACLATTAPPHFPPTCPHRAGPDACSTAVEFPPGPVTAGALQGALLQRPPPPSGRSPVATVGPGLPGGAP